MYPIVGWTRNRFHYAWIAIAVTFLIMLVTAGIRATPSVMMVPLERSFGWTRTTISFALAINLALFGLMGPFAAAAMQRFGMRRTVLSALAILAVVSRFSSRMSAAWQMVLIWGVLVGGATGATSMTLGAAVVNRWFTQHRGMAMGILTASSATGQLVFLPVYGMVVEHHGWRPIVLLVALWRGNRAADCGAAASRTTSSIGLQRFGEPAGERTEAAHAEANPVVIAFSALRKSRKARRFLVVVLHLLYFAVQAPTVTSATHFIAMCGDYGLSEVRGAGMLAVMGVCELFGTRYRAGYQIASITEFLLFWYYGSLN